MRRAACLAALSVVLAGVSCTVRPQMCGTEAAGPGAPSDCGPGASCVAGRCLGRGAVAAIATARRELYAPVDMAYVGAGDAASEAPPAIALLGRSGGGVLFLRFAVPLPPELAVVEAYLLLHRAPPKRSDPAPVVLHAGRIIEPWTGAGVSWARRPRVDDAGSVLTRIRAPMGPWVRLDVRRIVERWRHRGADDFGLAVLAEDVSGSGIALALASTGAASSPVTGSDPSESQGAAEAARDVAGALDLGPRLELYVK